MLSKKFSRFSLMCISLFSLHDWMTKPYLGWYDLLEKVASVKRSPSNACRAIHTLIRQNGCCLPIQMDVAVITIKRLKPLGTFRAYWPFLRMRSWATYLLENSPAILLGGHQRVDESGWGSMFHNFWSNYRSADPDHWLYSSGLSWEECVPVAFHGDEGRSSGKVPFLVLSFQPIIGLRGMESCNDSTYFGLFDSETK